MRDAAQRRHEVDLAQLRAASGAELKAELAQMRAASEAELAQLRTTCAEQAAELATLRDAAARHAAVAFEERAPQSYQVGESADAVDIAFANALHAANLPLLVACERVSKGMYKVATPELNLAYISPTSRPHLAHISPISRPYLTYTSPTST